MSEMKNKKNEATVKGECQKQKGIRNEKTAKERALKLKNNKNEELKMNKHQKRGIINEKDQRTVKGSIRNKK
ncbi:hypothetical protein RhiirA4_458243 [Rhizophagus irregularis]|uniref:Uncharacterized protein n=1 Tax=Rhizophagus irregularis TaxID=588596 RepID=A0A2I1GBR1_9GLOM|nr:hypothetical protein RhiirA4_458243 [Rhizophagus irregularis]